jgi:acyl transferase domain-containing protein
MFPGGGAQHAGMARQVYAQQATFAAAVDECAKLFAAQLGLDVRDAITVEPGSGSVAAMVEQPQLGLTSLFTVEYALAQLWLARGISPAILIGHSLGEYVAATLAGVLSLADAVRLVALRARLLQRLPAGVMLTVGASEHELLPLLPPGVSVAALNGPTQTVVSGSEQLIGQLESVLAERDVTVRRLRIVAGGHSSMVDSILAEFSAALADVVTRPPRIPCVSNLTGDLLTDEQATDPSYWVRHLRAPVRFTDGISTVLARSPVSLLEVGPGTTLSTLALQNGAAPPPIASLRHPLDPRSDAAMLATAVGELWLNGVRVDPHMINTA